VPKWETVKEHPREQARGKAWVGVAVQQRAPCLGSRLGNDSDSMKDVAKAMKLGKTKVRKKVPPWAHVWANAWAG